MAHNKIYFDQNSARQDGEHWLFKSFPAWDSYQREHYKGGLPLAEDLSQMTAVLYADVQLTDWTAPHNFYDCFFVSERLKALLDSFDLAPEQFYFFEFPLTWRGQQHPYWWVHTIRPRDPHPYFNPKHDLFLTPDTNDLRQGLHCSDPLRSVIEAAGMTGIGFETVDLSAINISTTNNPDSPPPIAINHNLSFENLWKAPHAAPVDNTSTPEQWHQTIIERLDEDQIEFIFEGVATDILDQMLIEHTRIALVADLEVTDSSKSQLGGRPLMPKDTVWPRTQSGQALFCLGQIFLNEVPLNAELPSEGVFTFFIDIYGCTKGWPMEPERHKVLFFASAEGLEPADFPQDLPICADIDSKKIGFKPYYDLPDNRWTELSPMQHSETYDELYTEISDFESPLARSPKLLGWPQCVQDYVGYGAARIREFDGDYTAYQTHPDELRTAARQWRLLFQIHADMTGLNDIIGDPDLYFMIRESDLAQHRFDDVALVAQGT
jgi:uncharacterized protein YwqG